MSSLMRSMTQVGWRPGPDPRSLAAFLRDLGYLPAASAAGAAGTVDVEDALRHFQAAAGLRPDGVAGARTVHALARARHALLDLRALAA